MSVKTMKQDVIELKYDSAFKKVFVDLAKPSEDYSNIVSPVQKVTKEDVLAWKRKYNH